MLWALIIAVLLAGSWLLGNRQGERAAMLVASESLASDEAQSIIFSLQETLRKKDAEVLEANRNSQTAAARTQAMQKQLDEALRENLSEISDLALYRRIETSVEPRGVVVDSANWSALQPDKLSLTLIQWQGRNRINGEVGVTLNYSRFVRGAEQRADAQDAEKLLWAVDLESAEFDFRFFQEISVLMPPVIDEAITSKNEIVLPDSIDISFTSADKRLKATNSRILWLDIAE